MGCTPLRVDHLDFNGSSNPHEIARITPVVGGGNVFYVVYSALQSNLSAQRGGVFLRTYNVDTATLSSVRNVNIDNSGAGRSSTAKDNRWPMLAQLSTGRLICAYSGNTANSEGLFVRESTDQGVTWTAEVSLTLGALSSLPQGMELKDISTDGTDVFMVIAGEGGTGSGDLFLFKRTGVGTWLSPTKIWDRTVSTQEAKFSRNAPASTAFIKVQTGPDKWKMAIVWHYTNSTGTENKIVCIYNDTHDDSAAGASEAANWTQVTIKDDVGEPLDTREPLTLMGSDQVLRCMYIKPLTNRVYSADSSDWGHSWNWRGLLTVPNTKNWEATHTRTTALNSAGEWFISTIDGGNGWYAYKNTGVLDAGWSLAASCFIDPPFTTTFQAGVGSAIILPDTKMSRLTSDTASGGSSNCRIWLTTLIIPPPPGSEPPPCLINGNINVCPGFSSQLCGPEGNGLKYFWTLPDGSHSTQRCIAASQPGTYSLVVTDEATGLTSECSTVVVVPDDCPEISTSNRLYRRGYIKVTKSELGFESTPMEKHNTAIWGGS